MIYSILILIIFALAYTIHVNLKAMTILARANREAVNRLEAGKPQEALNALNSTDHIGVRYGIVRNRN